MKYIYAMVVLMFSFTTLMAQEWLTDIPQEKIDKGEVTFYEYQKAFNDYCEALNVVDGYYYVDGEKKKMGGWKQFKRWEWFWESRIDPSTGKFPNTTAYGEFEKYLKENPQAKSPSGNWTSMGPSTTSGGYAGLGRLNCIGFRSGDANTFYVGSPSGGIWKTTNGASSWTTLGDGNAVIGVSDIIVIAGATTATDIVYIATGDRDAADNYSIGVLKSTDGGSSWSTTGLNWTASQGRRISRLLMDPTNNNILYAATTIGLYKTTNAGVSWSLLTGTSFIDLEFKPGNSTYLYGSTTGGTIYRSTNSGVSFSSVLSTGQARTELAVTAANTAIVYAVVANSSNGLSGIYKSTNSGGSFSQVFSGTTTNMLNWDCNSTSSGGQGWYDLCIASDPNNANIVFVGGVNTWKSTNGGSNWSISTHWSGTCSGSATNTHADKHFFAYQNGTSTLFECNDGGLYKTSNAGSTWTHLGSGLVTSQIYRMGVAQTASNEVIIGLQDNGTKALLSGSWNDVLGGDGMDCAIDHTNHNIQYGELYYGQIYRTTNHWGSYTSIQSGLSGSGAWVTPFVIDPTTASTVYIGKQDLFKSTNYGSGWTKISSWGGSTLRSIAVAPSNSNVIYTATTSTLYKTTNGGTSWSTITGTLPTGSASISFISVKNDDPNTAWVSMSGYNSYGVYQTTNGGSTWSNISAGLPSIPVNCVIQNKQNASAVELYAGTEVGVYVKAGTANWAPFYNGLPNVVVTEVEIYYDATPANSRIRAATYGRGVWESDLYSVAAAPVTNFSASTITPLVNQTVTFTDMSTNIPTYWTWSFNPPTVTYVNGTSANSQHPQVQFTSNGIYSVSLTSGNGIGTDNETKTNYIYAGTPGLWTGINTQDWNTASNWHNFIVPGSVQDISIPGSAISWPVYNGNLTLGTNCGNITMDGASEITILGDLTIPSGRTFTCNANSNVMVEGDWNNSGTFTEGTSNVEFTGVSNSTINTPPGGPVYLINETFSSWPGNWNGDLGSGQGLFYTNNSSYAGGSSPEARFYWQSGTTTKRMYHNAINTSGLSSLTLDFDHYVNHYTGTGTYTVKVQYSTDGTNWYDAGWSVSPSGNISATPVSLTLTGTQGVGVSNYYISFTITGNLYNINYWYIDNAQLYYSAPGIQSFYDLTDNKTGAELITNGDITVTNDVSVKPGAFLTNAAGNTLSVGNDFTLEANSSATASFIDNGTITVSGTSSMQNYYVDGRWHFISSPVASGVSNIFLGIYLQYWDEPTYTWNNVIATNYNLLPGIGYEVWSTLGNPTVSYVGGVLNSGNVSPSLLATDVNGGGIGSSEGWNLVGNPYPSALNWGTTNNPVTGYVRTNLDNTIYFWTGVQYASFSPSGLGGNGLGVNGGTQFIPSMQSFFVKANNAGPLLTIPANGRLHNAQANYKDLTEESFLRLKSFGNNYSDEVIITQNENATTGYDAEFDAYKLYGINEAPQLYAIITDNVLSINTIQEIEEETVVEIGFKAGIEGNYSIVLEEAIQMDNFDFILLEDIKEGSFTNLKEIPEYYFSSATGDDPHRFNLYFKDVTTDLTELLSDHCKIWSVNNNLYISVSGEGLYNVKVYDLLGQRIYSGEGFEAGLNKILLNSKAGYYLVQVEGSDQMYTQKVLLK